MIYTRKYSEIKSQFPFRYNARAFLRDYIIFFLSLRSRVDITSEWIRFPFYHHVFDDERKCFDRQLKYMKNFGDFISIDDSVECLRKKGKIGGRYFHISFDDGFENFHSNALPILLENRSFPSIFIPTDYIGRSIQKDGEDFKKFSQALFLRRPIKFMTWDECRNAHDLGVTIGSHTMSHVRLSSLSKTKVKEELLESKKIIENNLKYHCRHFACPWGVPDSDFRRNIDTETAKEVGYDSFLTTQRGPNLETGDPFFIHRDLMFAEWKNYQLKYFFSR